MKSLCLILIVIGGNLQAAMAKSLNHKFTDDPSQAEFITSDIELFWKAFDLLLLDTSRNLFPRDVY